MDTCVTKQDSALGYPTTEQTKQTILRQFWEACKPDHQKEHFMEQYFTYYLTRCQRFLLDQGDHVSIRTHSQLFEVARNILKGGTRSEATSAIMQHSLSDGPVTIERAENTVALCASLLLLIEFGAHRYGISGSTRLDWLADQSLADSVAVFFDGQKPILQPEGIRLGRLFTARNISLIGGIRVRWTTNLVDHLLLADDDRTVFIFHYVGFLRFHQGLVTFLPYFLVDSQS